MSPGRDYYTTSEEVPSPSVRYVEAVAPSVVASEVTTSVSSESAAPEVVPTLVYNNPRLDPKNYLEGPLSWNPSTRLRQLLARPGIVVAPGICDGISARCALEAGFTCLYQSGAATTASRLGQPDLAIATLNDFVQSAQMICSLDPTTPVIADADTGFGGPAMVARTVTQYARAGVAGLHIEDQVQTKRCGHLMGKQVVSREEFVTRIRAAVIARDSIPGGSDFVIIGRTDSAQVLGMEEAVTRLKLAADAGADVCFIEGVRNKELLESTVAALAPKPVLVNVISGGLTPSFTTQEAEAMGAKIIIFSLVSCVAAVHGIRAAMHSLKKTGTDFSSAKGMDPKAFFEVMAPHSSTSLREGLEGFRRPARRLTLRPIGCRVIRHVDGTQLLRLRPGGPGYRGLRYLYVLPHILQCVPSLPSSCDLYARNVPLHSPHSHREFLRLSVMGAQGISGKEVAKHNTRESCWIIVHGAWNSSFLAAREGAASWRNADMWYKGNVYDVTDFLDEHPGGSRIILKYAGKDATQEYDPIHPPNAITDNLPVEKHLGKVDMDTVEKVEVQVTDVEKARLARMEARPSLDEILNLHDFESIAKLVMPEKAWAYYSSAADDEITIRENHAAYHRIWFRPRILRDMTHVDYSTTILGQPSKMPIYITATALGKLGHPDGELNLTRAAAKHGVIQMIPTLASCSFDEIVDARQPNQTQFLQLYVNKDRDLTRRIVQHAEKRGITGLFITVDAPQLGRREKACNSDMRMKFEAEDPDEVSKSGDKVDRSQGAAKAITGFIDPGLKWSDIPWFQSITKMPLILKGVQTWEDALEAYDLGLAGVVLSNHGGRQLDFARSGIEVLVEVVEKLEEKRGIAFPNEKFQLFVDGGVRRATDVLKAVALGATAVGIGRPFLYAFSTYGVDGVDHALDILNAEFEMNMRLLGANTLKDVTRDMVDASSIHQHIVAVPGDRLYDSNYESMQVAQLRGKEAAKVKESNVSKL
ncbi:hypothetical protein EVG20_g845 [Dentipellis fragilis]|uniref:L-lactate dehydrogenase (cytochrome) n=1 Tax=Dentipellis fragilis TaxID=205917 RepID=A0A4Y9ZE55_9AGAM|nr:hypothetical protein EVG20_g845 [Dentipellis fragilis]